MNAEEKLQGQRHGHFVYVIYIVNELQEVITRLSVRTNMHSSSIES